MMAKTKDKQFSRWKVASNINGGAKEVSADSSSADKASQAADGLFLVKKRLKTVSGAKKSIIYSQNQLLIKHADRSNDTKT